MKRIRVDYVRKGEGNWTTFGTANVDVPQGGLTAEAIRAALQARYPDAEMADDYIRRIASEAVAKENS
jgi:hypothetical protein